jgi:hypothetical protein
VRHIRTITLCLIAACAIGALAASSASAALPEWGKCVKVPVEVKGKLKTKGKYANANCTEATGGEYEFLKGTSGIADTEFTNTMTTPEALLETSGGVQVKCSAQTATGSLSGAKEVSEVQVVFNGCYTPTIGNFTCENEFENNHTYVQGVIFTRRLKGKLGYVSGKGTNSPVVGLSLEPEQKNAPFAIFGCGEPGYPPVIFTQVGRKPRGANGRDSIISPISPVNAMGTETVQEYTQESGVQAPASFENGKPDFLESQVFNGYGEGGWEQSGQQETAVTKLNSGEELEIKA